MVLSACVPVPNESLFSVYCLFFSMRLTVISAPCCWSCCVREIMMAIDKVMYG